MRGRPAAHRPVAARIGSGLSLPASGRGGKSSFSVQVTQRMGQAQVAQNSTLTHLLQLAPTKAM
jgi:hypothetical protein